jgi:NhaA family Na+:H+ antiporter
LPGVYPGIGANTLERKQDLHSMSTVVAAPNERMLIPSRLVRRVLDTFQRFSHMEASGGIVLLVCTALALAWANSPWAEGYFHLWETPVTVGAPGFGLTESLHHWINDGLMAVFFFMVGLEIKREMLVGELSSVRQAALPIAAAIGGMVVPAGLYALLNAGGAGAAGWGIPMATDIAFALGIVALLGRRVPLALKVFLAALAIVDDIGAVLVIAIFYTASISWASLAVAGVVLAGLAALNGARVRHPAPYALLGLVLWVAFLKSGIHATIAGVLLAMTIPARTRIDQQEFAAEVHEGLGTFEGASGPGVSVLTNSQQQEAINRIENACEGAQSPLMRLEHALHGVVALGIMPIFALANAGVQLGGGTAGALASPVTLGIILGLVVGKPLGIMLAAWLAVRSGVAVLPDAASWRLVHGVSWLAGIGFTMSLFVAGLAFPDAALLDESKLGILAASLLAGVVGWVLLRSNRSAAAA